LQYAIFNIATRANNLNAWVDCKFDGGGIALTLASKMRLWLQDVISQIILELMLYVPISIYSSSFIIIVLHQLSGQLEQILKDVIFRFKQYV
jgi:hypothetical protein